MSRLDPKLPSSETSDVDDDGGGEPGYADSSLADLSMAPDARRHLENVESSFVIDKNIDQMNGARRVEEDDDLTGNVLDGYDHDRSSSPQAADSSDNSLFPQRSPAARDKIMMPPPSLKPNNGELTKKMSFIGSRSSSPVQDKPGNINLFSSDAPTDEDQLEPPSSPTPIALSAKKKRPGPTPRQDSENGGHSRTESNSSITTRRKGKFLRTRHSSQSSVSSIHSVVDDHDDLDTTNGGSTLGAGGRNSLSLSRTASLGSIASGVTSLRGDRNSIGGTAERHLARLEEEEAKSNEDDLEVAARDGEEDSDTDTPRTPTRRGSATRMPTDTAIATRVGNIEVPPTVARDLRSRFLPDMATPGPASPSKRLPHTPHPGTANTKTMTLKEQSSMIDRLQKENFDLKIKVYYLNDKIDKTSEEGVQELMKENVEFKVKVVEMGRILKALKKDNRELQQKIMELEDAEKKEGLESEVFELRETVENYRIEIEQLRERETIREEEMKAMKERELHREANFRQMRSAASSAGGMQHDILDELNDRLEMEETRRKKAEADLDKLRDELYQNGGRSHYEGGSQYDNRSASAASGGNSKTRLQNEVEDLKRQLHAQTSMLTSRNREKERLYQEIEELKLHSRNGDNQSMYDLRSASRLSGITANQSRASQSQMVEQEREEYENLINDLRDKVNALKLKSQELEEQLEQCMREYDISENLRQDLETEIDIITQDAQALALEREDSLRQAEEWQIQFNDLREEANEEIRKLEEIIDEKIADIDHMNEEAREREEGFEALQAELRQVTEIVVRLEDAQEEHNGTIQALEEKIREAQRTIEENETELTALESNLVEANGKVERSTVQMESLKGEIRFLREEQDGDKMRIGELERECKKLEATLQDEKENRFALENRLEEERRMREERSDMREQELSASLQTKETELLDLKNELRQMRKSHQKRTEDAKHYKQSLEGLEQGLRQAINDDTGSGESMIREIYSRMRQLQQTMQELEHTRQELVEKDRALKDRDGLLERSALDNRRLQELLEKERSGRKHDKAQIENLQNNHHNVRSSLSQQQKQLSDAEKARQKEARAIQALEARFKEELAERNNLLLALWIRLTKLCGPEWTTRNSLANAPTTPGTPNAKYSMESAVVNAFPGFSKNLLTALKAIENVVQSFKTRVRNVERDLWKEYQVVETALESRTRRLERLESLVRGGVMTGGSNNDEKSRSDAAKIKTENRLLKAEIAVLKRDALVSTSSAAGDDGPKQSLERSQTDIVLGSNSAAGDGGQEKRWILRLRELEKRLKQEREARLMDRDGAKKRLEEERGEKDALRRELERAKEKQGA